MIGISGSLISSKTLMELKFNPCGEVRRAQLAKSTLLTSMLVTLGSFQILMSVQMLIRERKATGSYRTYSIPSERAALVPEFAAEDLPSVDLQRRLLRLQ